MLKGINVNDRIEFVSSYDDAEPKTVFVLRPLTGEERNNLQDELDGKVKLIGTKLYDFLEMCVTEVKNFEFGSTVREKLTSISDQRVVAELVTKAGQISNMTRQDEKNS